MAATYITSLGQRHSGFTAPWPSWDSTTQQQLKLGRTWLDKCRNEHKHSSLPHIDHKAVITPPQWLIRIGDSMSTIRLVDTKTIIDPAEKDYAALSHCWDESETVPRTTTCNLETRLKNIPWTDLPTRYRDAVITARGLGFRHIWIDSLCVVRDEPEGLEAEDDYVYLHNDEDEFKEKLVNRHEVFLGAAVVICASSSDDTSVGTLAHSTHRGERSSHDYVHLDGTLCPPDFTVSGSVDVPVLGVSAQGSKRWYGQRDSKNHIKRHEAYGAIIDFMTALNEGPLASRAWASLERQSAVRIIHFTDRGLIWECKTSIATQRHPFMMHRSLGTITVHDRKSQPKVPWEFRLFDTQMEVGSRNLRHVQNGNEIYTRWQYLIQNYFQKYLHRDKSRLSALSGIASDVALLLKSKNVEDEYLAGIWKTDIAQGLLWKSHYPEVALHNGGSTSGIPSWSWASSRSGVQYFFSRVSHVLDVHPNFSLESYSMKLEGPDAFSNVTEGILCIRACSIDIEQIDLLDEKPNCRTVKEAGNVYKIKFPREMEFGAKTFQGAALTLYFDDDPASLGDSETANMRLVLISYNTGLILRKIASEVNYRRVGLFTGHVSPWPKHLYPKSSVISAEEEAGLISVI